MSSLTAHAAWNRYAPTVTLRVGTMERCDAGNGSARVTGRAATAGHQVAGDVGRGEDASGRRAGGGVGCDDEHGLYRQTLHARCTMHDARCTMHHRCDTRRGFGRGGGAGLRPPVQHAERSLRNRGCGRDRERARRPQLRDSATRRMLLLLDMQRRCRCRRRLGRRRHHRSSREGGRRGSKAGVRVSCSAISCYARSRRGRRGRNQPRGQPGDRRHRHLVDRACEAREACSQEREWEWEWEREREREAEQEQEQEQEQQQEEQEQQQEQEQQEEVECSGQVTCSRPPRRVVPPAAPYAERGVSHTMTPMDVPCGMAWASS